MGGQFKLVLLLVLSVGIFQVAVTSTISTAAVKADDFESSEELDDAEANKILESEPKPVVAEAKKVPAAPSTTVYKTSSTSTTHKPLSDEILNDLIEASKHSTALADDPRFNKLLPDKLKLENATTVNKSDENYDDEDYYYDEDYNYEDSTNINTTKSTKTSNKPSTKAEGKQSEQNIKMKPIKEDEKLNAKTKQSPSADEHKNDILDSYDDEDDYNDDEDDDDDDDDLNEEEEIVFSENVPCPRYCVCARNVNSYLVATCSRLDPGTQKFGSDITDLIVTDVGPKYPILLRPKFFLNMGLKQVASIKIANCTIEYLHPDAFHGLDELYSVNLTNVGLAIINADSFAKNKKLRMLTISGNDLNIMSSMQYLLKSQSLEELDLSRNNLIELNPSAFSQLPNLVYINLSQNNLQKIPEYVFNHVELIEEIDLSYNSLQTLPENIFKRNALSILHLKYNAITSDLRFGTSDLLQLDLSFNTITQVHHGMFDKMTGLTNLNLKGNGIIKIQPDSFLTLKNLRHIDLSINELDQISSMAFFRNSELDVIRLNDNPKLSQLPTDGFLSHNGFFTVYYLDISNCAIGALGHKTFATMPHLATLKLAWNNINNLERDTFSSLTKLTELDLSNNLIKKLDDHIFKENNDLTKLNLAGNPIHKLSVRLFLPLTKLRELDVSDCELNALFIDNQYGMGRKYKFYETLRSLNASSNEIKKISTADVKKFRNLRTLDITHNPLKCNEEFQDFISYVSLKNNLFPIKVPTLANLESTTSYEELEPQSGWAKLAQAVCKHLTVEGKTKKNKLEKRIEQADKELDDDTKNLLNIMENNKLQKILKDTSRKSEVVVDDQLEENGSEEEFDTAHEVKDDDEELDSEYDDEDNDEDENVDNKKETEKKDKLIINHGVKVEEIDLTKNLEDKELLEKILQEDDDDEENSEEQEIIIEHGHIYYSGYRFLIPLLLFVSCALAIVLVVIKLVTMVRRKQGERYRMALLASHKNSIVYQKLTEDIKPTEKESKQPKVHRYAPINHV